MREIISELNDEEAIKLLSIVYNKNTSVLKSSHDNEDMLEFAKEFMELFEIKQNDLRITEGEIAKSMLHLLMIDIESSKIISDNIVKEKHIFDSFGYASNFGTFSGGIGVITMSLVLLRTYISFSKDKDGKTTFEIKIKPLGDKQINKFIDIAKHLMSNIIETKDE